MLTCGILHIYDKVDKNFKVCHMGYNPPPPSPTVSIIIHLDSSHSFLYRGPPLAYLRPEGFHMACFEFHKNKMLNLKCNLLKNKKYYIANMKNLHN